MDEQNVKLMTEREAYTFTRFGWQGAKLDPPGRRNDESMTGALRK